MNIQTFTGGRNERSNYDNNGNKIEKNLNYGIWRNGRFKISYKRMQQITGKTILNDSFIDYLSEHCLIAGMTVINLGSEFAVIETGILSGYRNVPQGIIEKVLKE